eukprot:TRINITY_DN9267_c0_g1_i1.p1 TRINITY_DN9267_c0_g1~~TRINITY_DN9267_c0_g1_i1.p1  ORF type:complete len:177 (+),score=22.77 TRINITY_DN9267_c0_g1_i1:176-706(+)
MGRMRIQWVFMWITFFCLFISKVLIPCKFITKEKPSLIRMSFVPCHLQYGSFECFTRLEESLIGAGPSNLLGKDIPDTNTRTSSCYIPNHVSQWRCDPECSRFPIRWDGDPRICKEAQISDQCGVLLPTIFQEVAVSKGIVRHIVLHPCSVCTVNSDAPLEHVMDGVLRGVGINAE